MSSGRPDAVVLRCRRILGTGVDVLDGWLRIEAGRVVDSGTGEPTAEGTTVTEIAGWLAPGFVDLHVHGGGGAGFQSGRMDEVETAVAFHRRHGTTTMLASLVSAPVDDLVASCGRLEEAVRAGLIAGVHLEGPFLSPHRRGAHDPGVLIDPDPGSVERLLGSGPVRVMTLAPELDGGLDAIRRIVASGVVAAIGHTDASYEVTVAGIDAGARLATHLFNGMRPLHHRDPGPITALVEDERVVLELINDGVHVHEALVRRLLTSAERGRVALVTDAIAAAGLPDGEYRLGSLDVVVRDGVSLLAPGDSIAGSTTTLAASVAAAVRAGVPVPDAVAAATTIPAGVLGRSDVGRLTPGSRADLVVLDDELAVSDVWLGGTPVQ